MEARMTNIVTITHADKSKSGKDRVYFNGKNNWQEAYYVGNRCESVPPVGATIDADTSSSDFKGKTVWFLNRWKPVRTEPNPAPQRLAGGMSDQAQELAAKSFGPTDAQARSIMAAQQKPKGWSDLPTGDMLRYVSNVVGTAIEACLIKEPKELAPWCAAAYRSAEALRSGDVPEFDNDVPSFSEPDPAEQHGFDEGEPPYGDEQQPGDPF
jgi:hypothetical protein